MSKKKIRDFVEKCPQCGQYVTLEQIAKKLKKDYPAFAKLLLSNPLKKDE